MICKKCGFELRTNETKCPVCGGTDIEHTSVTADTFENTVSVYGDTARNEYENHGGAPVYVHIHNEKDKLNPAVILVPIIVVLLIVCGVGGFYIAKNSTHPIVGKWETTLPAALINQPEIEDDLPLIIRFDKDGKAQAEVKVSGIGVAYEGDYTIEGDKETGKLHVIVTNATDGSQFELDGDYHIEKDEMTLTTDGYSISFIRK